MKALYILTSVLLLLFIRDEVRAQQLIEGYGLKTMSTPYHAITGDPDGNLFVYYHFDRVNGEYVGSLAKLDQTGQSVTSFNNVYTNGVVGHVEVQDDGKILVSGDYTQVNGQPSAGLLRLNTDGTVDLSFSSAIQQVGAFGIQSDGKIVAFAQTGLVRFNSDGSLDESFVHQSVSATGVLKIGPDDYIHVPGRSTVYRLKPNGEIDPDFFMGTGVNENHISAIEVQSDGKIILGGFFTAYNGVPVNSIVRLLPSGQVDTSFDPGIGPRGQIFQIVERQNKKILLGGQFTHYNDQQGNLVQLGADGSLEKIIAIVMPNNITYMVEFPDQKVAIAGEFSFVNGVDRKYIIKFNSDHTIDNNFKPMVTYTNSNDRFVEVNSKSEVFTGGFDGVFHGASTVRKLIVKLDVFGRYTSSFSRDFPGQAPWIKASSIQHDDKVLLSGFLQGHSGPTLLRLNPDASIDESFQIGTGPTVGLNSPFAPDVIVQKDTLLYIGGNFEKFNGTAAKNLVALKMDGSVYKTFPSMPQNSQVIDIAFQSDGKVILTGFFDLPSGLKEVIRLNSDGTIDDSFSVTISGNVSFVRTDNDDRIYIGGMIYSVNGALVSSLVRLLPDGNIDTTFDTGAGFSGNNHITSLELLPDGKVAVGGWFSGYQNEEANGFVILDQSGARSPAALIHFGKNSSTKDMEYRNGALYLAGRFVKDDYSDVFGNVKIALEPLVIPAAPQDLTANLHADGTFQLQWSDQSGNELLFILERSIGTSSAFTAYDTLSSNTVSTFDSNIEARKEYFYRVKSLNEAGESSWSNITSQIWLPAPEGGVNLTVTREQGNEFVLSWESSATNHDGYIIEREESPLIGYLVLDTVAAEINTYVDVVEKDKTYLYKVAAYNASGKIVSNEVSSIISGIDSNEFLISVYPVPAKHTLYAKIPNRNADGQWRLLSASGRNTRLSGQVIAGVSAMDVQDIPPGIYTVQYLESGKVLVTSRIIIGR